MGVLSMIKNGIDRHINNIPGRPNLHELPNCSSSDCTLGGYNQWDCTINVTQKRQQKKKKKKIESI